MCVREEVGESRECGGKIKNGGGRWRNLRWFWWRWCVEEEVMVRIRVLGRIWEGKVIEVWSRRVH